MKKNHTFYITEKNFEKLEAHCRLTGKVPSRVIDILIEDFLYKIK